MLTKKILLLVSACLVSFSAALHAKVNEPKIDDIELYLINVEVKRHFSFGDWNSRQHVVMRVKAGNLDGWGEGIFALNKLDFDLTKSSEALKKVLGMTPSEVLEATTKNRKMFGWELGETLNMALWDICAKANKKSAVDMLGLTGKAPVNGMFCILENNPKILAEKAEIAKKDNLKNYIKLKIFGDSKLDCELVRTLRKSMGKDCFIVADANCGYKNFKSIKELADALKLLSEAGLNALEDPAKLNDKELIELQDACHAFNLSLIPDVNMRPSWSAREDAKKGMGDFYNLHPGCMVDMLDMARLADKINSWGAKIMIGDNSLVGPSCTIYQQVAIACNAAWVEALEKPQESAIFTDCIIEQSTYRTPDGLYTMKPDTQGWGLKVDIEKLKQKATRWVNIKK